MKNHKNKIVWILFGIIILIASIVRLWSIESIPPSPDWDEAALGYNAYSVMLTGKDEYGKFIPVVLESFDDYKPALYAYLIIPFLKIFDLSVLSVRLPSAIMGIVAVAVVFFIIRELFEDGISIGAIRIRRDWLALTTSFLLALSPWHIQFSRVGFEAQVGLSFNLIALLFFLKALKNKYFLPLSFTFAALNIYVYQSEKVYTPLLFLVLFIVFWKRFLSIPRRWLVGSFVLAVVVVLPMFLFILGNPQSLSRAKGVSVFSDSQKLLGDNQEKIARDNQNGDVLGLVLDNRRFEYVKAFVAGYISHFEPNWLFYRGDVERHHPPFMGLLYIWTLPFILIGLYFLIFAKTDKHTKWFLILYLLIAPIPASITIDVPHAVRTINFIPIFDILTAIGFLFVLIYLLHMKKLIKIPVLTVFAIIIALNTVYYLDQYFVQAPYYYSKYWQYGWKEAVVYTQEHAKKFDQVVVSNVSPLDQSYIFYLFFTKYDPRRYQYEGGTKSARFSDQHTAFGKYVFRPIDWNNDKLMKNTLFVGRPEDLPDNRGMIFYYLDGQPAIVTSEKNE